ncbi:Uncharacterised protein [Candidatus Burarchaeum australiense]|nr:Uncharacterised protein [Candidatus Burarchaeum australiense]
MRFGIAALFGLIVLLLSGFAFAAETAANESAGAEGALSVNSGAQLLIIGTLGSIIVILAIYFLLSKRR